MAYELHLCVVGLAFSEFYWKPSFVYSHVVSEDLFGEVNVRFTVQNHIKRLSIDCLVYVSVLFGQCYAKNKANVTVF